MSKPKRTITVLIAAMVAALTLSAALAAPPAAASGTTVKMTGVHAHEEFCQTMVRQLALMDTFDPFDLKKRNEYFANQKKLNATLVRSAPPQFAGDIALQTRNANAMMDAQTTREPARIKAAAAGLRAPANIAASKRMASYCGATMAP